MSEPPSSGTYKYQAFISYSHAADGKLAPAVQDGLRRFGNPWYRRPSMQIFRDQTGLAVTPDLWGDIKQALEQSEWFILLASPEVAQSPWVDEEIEFWLEHRSADRLLIVLTAGKLSWSHGAADFDWKETNALPRRLEKVFKTEPLWADLSWAKTQADLSLRRPRFFVEIAKLVAGVRQVPLEGIFDEAAAQSQKAVRLLRAGAAVLAVFAVAALGTAVVAVQAKRIADRLVSEQQVELEKATERQRLLDDAKRVEHETQLKQAHAAKVAARAAAVLPEDRELSMLLALEAVGIAPTSEAEDALRQTLLDLAAPVVLWGHEGVVYSAEFSPDGLRALTSSADGTVRLWDTVTGTNLHTWKVSNTASGDQPFGSFSSDGAKVLTMLTPETLAIGHWESTAAIQLHDAATGDLLVTIPDSAAVRASLSPDGTQIVTAGFDAAVKIWDARTGKIQFKLPGHENRVVSASFSSNGKRIVTGSWDGTARVWDASTGQSLAVLDVGKQLDVEAVAFGPDDSTILTLSGEASAASKYLQVWDWIRSPGGSLATFNGHQDSINDVAFSPDGKWLVTASSDKTARIWDAATGKCLHVLSGHEEAVNGVAFSPDGKWVVTASGDRTALIWQAATGRSLMGLGWDNFVRTGVAFSPDGKRIITGTTDGQVPIYTCAVCGSVADLTRMAQTRVTRALTEAEKEKYVRTPP